MDVPLDKIFIIFSLSETSNSLMTWAYVCIVTVGLVGDVLEHYVKILSYISYDHIYALGNA